MKHVAILCLVTTFASTGVASAAKADINPLGAVYELLDGLKAKILQEADVEAKAYREYYQWCDKTSQEIGFSIKTATAKKTALEAKIGELKSDIEVGTSKIEDLAAAVSSAQDELKEATAVRKEEAFDFAASEKELTSTIDTLDRAIAILEKEMAASPAAFAQINTKSLTSVVQTLGSIVEAAGFSSADSQKLTALVQNQQDQAESEDEDAPGAPAASVYENNSGSIVDVLESLKEKSESSLAAARKAEAESKQLRDVKRILERQGQSRHGCVGR
jgi:chromosome segregation ATPase